MEKYENIFSIIKTIESLEWCYRRGITKPLEYDEQCKTLIHQYGMCVESIPGFRGLDDFIQTWGLTACNMAKKRLIDKRTGYQGEGTDKNIVYIYIYIYIYI